MTELADQLPDDFARALLSGSLEVVKNSSNPVRFHQCAATLRELFTYVLDFYAPPDEVRACPWFVQAADTKSVTRIQRAIYATQGGLTDEFITGLGLEIADLHSEAIEAVNRLHSATHVRPDRLVSDQDEINAFINEVLGCLDGLLSSFEMGREAVGNLLSHEVFSAIMMAFVTESFGDIDLLAGRGYEVGGFMDVDEPTITAIDARFITLEVSGEAPVTLHYGPKNDAAEIQHDFPFTMVFRSAIATPEALEFVHADIDNSSWFDEE